MNSTTSQLASRATEFIWCQTARRPFREENRPVPFSTARVFWPDHYKWAPASKWGDQIREALSSYASIENRPIQQPSGTCIAIEVSFNAGPAQKVYFDISDYPSVDNDTVASGS